MVKVAERLTAKISVPAEAVPTFIGIGGQSVRKLRRLCVGCELELSQVADGTAEVSLLAEDEGKLGVAVGLVEKWVGQQRVCSLSECRDVAGGMGGKRVFQGCC